MDVEIDYDNLDVAAIMDQVKKAAAARPPDPRREETESVIPAGGSGPVSARGASFAPPPEGPPGFKSKIKAKALKAMAPFFPVIRFLALPLHEELKTLTRDVALRFDRNEHRSDISETTAADRYRDLDRAMEYIKLLHTLNHNLVVEITKLRIEFDGLKSKARILEKDLESSDRRERALEARLLS